MALGDKISNERTKLTATFVSSLGVAIFAVGGVAPTLSLITGQAPAASGATVLVFALICYTLSGVLHLAARRALEGIRNDDD